MGALGAAGEVVIGIRGLIRRDGAPQLLPQLPSPARVLICAVVAGYVVAVGLGIATLGGSLSAGFRASGVGADAAVAGIFALAAIVSIEISMRLAWPRARKDRISRDLLAAWMLPVALLLPPVYVLIAVLIPCLFMHLRVWHRPPVKLIYTMATLGLAYGAASLVYRGILGLTVRSQLTAAEFGNSARAAGALIAAAITWWAINTLLICAIVALTAGASAIRGFFGDREGFIVDVVAACAGGLAAVLWAVDPVFLILLVPPVLLLQHQLFSGLRKAVRTDLLTDVANPQYWREVAGREIDRATASNAHLAVLMVDVDHFKAVNDRYGHLAGDEVLAAVARTVAQALRPRDLVGRLGGEEFGAVLSGLNLLDAEGAAERLRVQVGEIRVRADSGDWIAVTVSVGVSELSVTGGDLHHLLEAADTALYAAKAAGRNCVRIAGRHRGQIIDLSSFAARGAGSGADETPQH